MQSPVATNLRAALAERNMTQEALARAIGASNRSVAGWCLGETNPRWEWLVKIAHEFGREPAWFYAYHNKAAA